jgi:hypothetical protein
MAAVVTLLQVTTENSSPADLDRSHEDMKIGAKILDTLDEAIRLRDKVLLVLSEASCASEWVEDEVTKAFAEERARGDLILFPVRIDDAVFKTEEAWALKLRDNRNIGDFRDWKKDDAYRKTLERLLRDLLRVAETTVKHRASNPWDHLSIGGDTRGTFTGLTFEEMCETLKSEGINLAELSPEAVSGIKNCVVQFNDSHPGLLHVLWYYRDALQKGVRVNSEASSFFNRLSGVGLLFRDSTTGYVLTDKGKEFLLIFKGSASKQKGPDETGQIRSVN